MPVTEKTAKEISDEEISIQKQFADRVRKRFEGRKCYVRSFGCQQNVSDGEKIKGMLLGMGGKITEDASEADFIIYNTCAVRENAEDRAFGNIGALKHFKEQNPDLIIAICGCMTQQERIAEKIRKSYTYVDIVFGTHSLHKLPELLYKKIYEQNRVFDQSEDDRDIVEGLPIERDGKFKAWLPIMYGCDNFCSYCIVPYVRGRERSRKSENIIAEAREIVSAGYKEIMLLGQNVNSYGKNIEGEKNFSALLKAIDGIEGDFRIRFMTSHPKDCTKELIDTIAESEKICHHIHLPVQSGSNEILRRMNRKYTAESYCELIEYAKKKMPDVTFTSDIIVGFPGETEEDFEKTEELVKKVRFSALYTFIFSKREGTAAAEYEDTETDENKGRRFRRLLELQEKIGTELREKYIGSVARVLIDSKGKNEGYVTGRDEYNNIIVVPGGEEKIGEMLNVRITKALNWALEGEITE